MLVALCPECGTSFKADEKFAGRRMRCKRCSGVVSIPQAPPQEETAFLTEEEREELERTRPATASAAAAEEASPPPPAKSGRKLGPGPRKGPGLAKRPGAPGGALKSRRSAAAERPQAAAAPASRKRLLVIAGAGLALVAVLAVVWAVFLRDGGGKDDAKGKGARAMAKPAAGAAKDGGDEEPEDAAASALAAARTGTAEDEGDGDGDGDGAVKSAAAGPPDAAVDVLGIVPAEAGTIVRVDVPALKSWVEKLAGALQPVLGGATDVKSLAEKLPEEMKTVLSEAEIDLERDVRGVWLALPAVLPRDIAGSVAGGGAGAPMSPPEELIVVVEGTFSAEKVTAALQKSGHLGTEAREGAGLTTYALDAQGKTMAFGFLSKSQLIVATDGYMARIRELRSGEGESLRGSETLRGISGGFKGGGALWVAAAAVEDSSGDDSPEEPAGDAEGAESGDADAGTGAEAGDAETPAARPTGGMPSFPCDAYFASIGPTASAGGLALRFAALAPNDPRAQQYALQLGALRMVALGGLKGPIEAGQMPPALLDLVKAVKVSTKGNRVDVALDVSPELVGQLVGMALQLSAGGLPGRTPGAEPEASAESPQGLDGKPPPGAEEMELPPLDGDGESGAGKPEATEDSDSAEPAAEN